MAGEKEIRSKIRSVKNMQKITSAMEMVAASKIRKAQKQMEASRPYAERIRRVIGHLAHANPDYKHPFLVEREAKRVGYIIISTDRGLCGGLNVNMFKTVINELVQRKKEGVEVDLALVGAKAVAFFRRLGGNVVGTASHLGDKPTVNDLIGSIKIMLDSYSEGTIDRLYLVHNEFATKLITDLCMFEPDPETKELLVTRLYPGVTREAIQEQCGWQVKFSDDLANETAPTMEELQVLRAMQERTRRAHEGEAA